MEIEGTVGTVEARRTKGDPLYFIPIDGVDYSTFEKPLALQAQAGQGLRGKFAVEERPNDRNPSKPYKNLLAVVGWYGTPKPVGTDIPFAQQQSGGGRRSYSKTPEERREIAQMNSRNVAFTFVGNFADHFQTYDDAERTALQLSDRLFSMSQNGEGNNTPVQLAEVTPINQGSETLTAPEGGLTPPTPGEGEWS